MGLLADVFSYGDGLKRKVRGLLDDPVGAVDLGARRFNEDQSSLQNLFANAYPMAGNKTVLNTPQQRKQMQAEAANKALEVYGGLLGATMWQGPPVGKKFVMPSMTIEQAQKIVANEDYLPWDQVAQAKKVLGIKEQTAADIWAEMLAAKKR